MSDDKDNLLPDAMHDYEVECEEHIFAARQTLLSLESLRDLESPGQESLDVLFRAFHTIKGLSGMVGAQSIEQAAHHLEGYLAAVRKGEVRLSEPGFDFLLDGVALLESSVVAFVRNEAAPDIGQLAERLAILLSGATKDGATELRIEASPGDSLSPEKQARVRAAVIRGEQLWNLTFTPAPELAARGINVASIREKIRSSGSIIDSEPVPSAGGVQFRFLLATTPDFDLTSWMDDGITIEPFQPVFERSSRSTAVPATRSNGSHLVRVELSRLDDLMRSVAELVISRGRLQGGLLRAARHLPARERRDLEETTQAIEQQLRQLREGIMRVRMVPIRDLFGRVRLVVRDLTRQSGKQIELVFEGEETEVDKYLIERMADPLLHLIRNAVSHGIEDADERQAAGKPSQGRITVRAAAGGGTILLEVEDDGRGVQVEEVFARAKRAGLVSPAAVPDPSVVLDLLCTLGFSTRDIADRVSGRGVGMDVVRVAVETLGGTLALDSRTGAGTRFICRLPLTLVVADVLTVTADGRLYAISQTLIREVVPVAANAITTSEHIEFIRYRSGVLPMLRLSDLFGISRPKGDFVALVAGEGTSAVAVAVDRAVGLEEVVVRALVDPLVQVLGVSGAADLGDGRPVLILDPPGLARIARQRRAAHLSTGRG